MYSVRIGMYSKGLYSEPEVRTVIMISVLSTYRVHTYLRSTYLVSTWDKKYVPSTYLG